jgi:hypothetical protein
MKTVQVTMYEAFDTTLHPSEQKCRDYEDERLHQRLAGLTEDQVRAALDRTDASLADALERAGLRIRNARRKAGEFKRPPPPKLKEEMAKREAMAASEEAHP